MELYGLRSKNIFIILSIFLLCLLIPIFVIYDKMIILLGFSLFLFFDFLLKNLFEFKAYLRILLYLLIFFIILEFILQQNNFSTIQKISQVAEIIILLSILTFAILKSKNWYTKEFKTLTYILVSLIICNFVSTMFQYQNIHIFIISTLDYCKYFTLIYFITLIKIDDKDILKLLKVFSIVIVILSILSILQFLGIQQFFDIFKGRFEIIERNGFYRSIGFFPYPIELGNYCAVIFCLYYFLNKYKYKETWLYFISILLVINIVLSGTRTSLLALIIVFILSNLKSARQIISAAIIIVISFLIINNFMDIQQIIDNTKVEYTGMTPRQYYTLKSIEVWKNNPIAGIGFGTYGAMKYRLQTNDVIFNKYNIHDFDFANLKTTDIFYAQILPEFGIIGVLLLFALGKFFYSRYKILKEYDKSNCAYIYVFLTMCILALNSSSIFFSPHIGTFFWFSMGMILKNYLLLYTKNESLNVK
ncbi:O-antigen ligase family protein [Clostridium pasteurianum]|uniref:O-antigen ligase family protein n=1 Tax=Clostridium pasteurianum TaxID=1501 RepID=UPI002260A918|nr:O-antigen ligase family protein [Clostridium pasteurianum]UZW14985.1 O-antigen ligase family protein [Clostridium pasteurianum]